MTNGTCKKQKICYSSDMKHHNKISAFTLAEVLITLGIIGFVAALTIPTLVTKYKKEQTVVQLRKVYSDVENAIRLSESVNGPRSDWKYPYRYNSDSQVKFILTYYLPYFSGAQYKHSSDMPTDFEMVKAGSESSSRNKLAEHYLLLNNGVVLGFFINMDLDASGYFWLFADINGFKGPNKMGRDQFVFDPSNYDTSHFKMKFWCSGNTSQQYTAEQLMQGSDGYSCNANNTNIYRNFCCGRVIELSGWKIPEGYPW